MRLFFVIGSLLALFNLTGCINENSQQQIIEPSHHATEELTKLSSNISADQNPANQAKEIVSQYEEVARVRAINNDNQLIIGVDVKQFDRFNLQKVEKKITKEIIKNFSNMQVTLSTDQKILLELKELEQQIEDQSITENQLKERMNKIKKLSEEET